jgi:hypothetical protein
MLSAEEHPGIFYFMVGMIVLVMSGVGLSLLVDRRLKSSSGFSEAQRDVAMAEEELGSLRNYHAERSKLLESYGTRLSNGISGKNELREQLSTLRQHRSELDARRNRLQIEIPSLQEEFSRYRAEYRRQIWAAATGEKLGTLTIRGGRQYFDAVITRVSDVGIEIRHKDGIARVQAPDLDGKWQDRFQWSDEDRRARLNEELANHESIAAEPVPEKIPVADPLPIKRQDPAKPAETEADAAKWRTQIIAWRSNISRLTRERVEAQSQGNIPQSSVTGSLETWRAKSARLSGEIAKARTALSIAKSRLAQISPSDPLLRSPEHDPGEF